MIEPCLLDPSAKFAIFYLFLDSAAGGSCGEWPDGDKQQWLSSQAICGQVSGVADLKEPAGV